MIESVKAKEKEGNIISSGFIIPYRNHTTNATYSIYFVTYNIRHTSMATRFNLFGNYRTFFMFPC
jgi:hypothetical protein